MEKTIDSHGDLGIDPDTEHMKKTKLGERMKSYEKQDGIEPHLPFVVRLDGKNFSTFTKGMKKPFDKYFVDAMVKTMNDMVLKFHCQTGFCCSDEITLIFNRLCKSQANNPQNKVHSHKGRFDKLNSICASYCTVKFNQHVIEEFNKDKDNYTKQFMEKINKGEALFDSRILVFGEENDAEITNHMIWRSVYDCHRNTVATFGRHYIGKKKVLGLDCSQQITLMGKVWDEVPLNLKYGVYAKKELIDMKKEIKGKMIEFTRGVLFNKVFKIKNTENVQKMLLASYWSDVDVLKDLDVIDFCL